MSIGYSARCKKVYEDEQTVEYNYSCGIIGNDTYKNDINNYDGSIHIMKKCFIEPIIKEKKRKKPNGKKEVIIKRIIQPIEYEDYLLNDEIIIQNSKACPAFYKKYGVLASKLLYKILYEYQLKGIVPDYVSIDY